VLSWRVRRGELNVFQFKGCAHDSRCILFHCKKKTTLHLLSSLPTPPFITVLSSGDLQPCDESDLAVSSQFLFNLRQLLASSPARIGLGSSCPFLPGHPTVCVRYASFQTNHILAFSYLFSYYDTCRDVAFGTIVATRHQMVWYQCGQSGVGTGCILITSFFCSPMFPVAKTIFPGHMSASDYSCYT
jgi:hypothetical protein